MLEAEMRLIESDRYRTEQKVCILSRDNVHMYIYIFIICIQSEVYGY